MSSQPHSTDFSLPAGLASVALVDIRDICAAAAASESAVRLDIKRGLLSEPIRFGPRCSRWLASDAQQYLARRIEDAKSRAAEHSRVTRERALKAGKDGLARRLENRARKKRERELSATTEAAA